MATVDSGTFTGVSGVYASGNGLLDASFFKAGTTTDTYAGNVLVFGFFAENIIITNEGANDLCYEFPNQYLAGSDSGVVKAGQTVTLRKSNKNGMKLRSRTGGSATNYLVTAI
jgi:hypothetical protein